MFAYLCVSHRLKFYVCYEPFSSMIPYHIFLKYGLGLGLFEIIPQHLQQMMTDEEDIMLKPVPMVFSWGRSDMGTLLRMKDEEQSFDGVFVYSNPNRVILHISSNEYHTACITSTSDVLLCGSNEEGLWNFHRTTTSTTNDD